MFLSLRLSRQLVSLVVVSLGLVLPPGASAQNVTFGVVTGANVTNDFRPTASDFLGIATQRTSDASQWFLIGPSVELGLPKGLALEVDAIRRRVRFKSVTLLNQPIPLPTGGNLETLSFFETSVSTWQYSILGKYRLPERRVFLEVGPSFLPQKNGTQTAVTIGSGVDIPVWRVNVSPALRYTRWLNNANQGGVSNQVQFLIGVQEPNLSMHPKAFGRPLGLGIVSGFGFTKLLEERDDPQLRLFSGSNIPISGLMMELWLFGNVFAEFDGLYRPAYTIDESPLPDGSEVQSTRASFLTWEFPIVLKYVMPLSGIMAIAELGPSFRSIAHATSENYSHHGITAGLGVSARAGLKITPTIRYTRWARDKKPFGVQLAPSTSPNQLELVVKFSF